MQAEVWWTLLKELAQAFIVFSQETFRSFPITISLTEIRVTICVATRLHTHQKFWEKQSDKGSGS